MTTKSAFRAPVAPMSPAWVHGSPHVEDLALPKSLNSGNFTPAEAFIRWMSVETGTELQNPNFAAMAEAVGVRGIRLEDPGDVEAGMAAALAHDGPVLVDAVVSRTELVMPPAVTTEMAKGFTLYMVKAVMSGRGDELIDLARTNLWR